MYCILCLKHLAGYIVSLVGSHTGRKICYMFLRDLEDDNVEFQSFV
jgi:hypothetical protein